jgi:cyclophilin family peptidyl-prolyl cis-trans isomerase
MGDIVLELRGDMPITTGNFRDLVEQGVYDGTIFHRVIDGFMIRGEILQEQDSVTRQYPQYRMNILIPMKITGALSLWQTKAVQTREAVNSSPI